MRIILSVAILAAACGAVLPGAAGHAQSRGNVLVNPTGVQAPRLPWQTQPSWERDLQRYYDRQRMARQRGGDPLAGLRTTGLDRRRAMLRQFYGDPARALGLPANPRFGDSPESTAPPLEFAPNVSPLDVNGDGAVTRNEYFSARQRFVLPAPRNLSQAQRATRRLDTQFRALDANKDGIVTPDETAPYPDARF